MPQPKELRRLLLSWRPQLSTYGAKSKDWRDVFKQRMRHQCRDSIEVIDVLEPGMKKVDQREGPWTEFMAVVTMDYLDACEAEPDHELLTEVLHELQAGVEGKHYWVVRLESGELVDLTVVCGSRSCKPWADYPQWHPIPPKDFMSTTEGDLSTAVDTQCVSKLKAHGPGCQFCAAKLHPFRP